MFSEIDNIIFPDSCEVIEIVPSQHYVYPIFKCGRSSLIESVEFKDWNFVDKKDICKIQQPITVFLRDPRERFLSGVNTYLQHLKSFDSSLDQHTALYFINNYLFLNRHYAPQFFWILNLYRFTDVDAQIKLCDMQEISQLTDQHSRAKIDPITPELKQKIENMDWSKLELYFYLDYVLFGYIGQTIKISDLIHQLKNNHQDLYELVFQKSFSFLNVLSKT